jgi:6-phosphogluconolactonase
MKTQRVYSLVVMTLFALSFFGSGAQAAEKSQASREYLVFIGTYTGPKSQGIYAFRFDAGTGRLSPLGLAAATANPSFLAVDPSRRFLYAVNEVGDFQGQKSGALSAFAIDLKSGKLRFLNQVASRGADPCYVSLDRTGKYVMVANYSGGNVAVFPMLADGRLGEASAFVQHHGHGVNPQRQEGPHAHMIETSPDNRFVLATDLGLDEVLAYRFDAAKGTLTANDPPFGKVPAGAGPRHFAFSLGGKFVYVINEMGSSVTTLSYDAARGAFKELQTLSTLPKDFKGRNDDAEVAVHPSGKFLYGSNRGHDSIAVFATDPQTGTLRLIEIVPTGGKEPRSFAIDPTGKYLIAANQNSDSLVVFRIDAESGRLTPAGQTLEVGSPVCVTFVALK